MESTIHIILEELETLIKKTQYMEILFIQQILVLQKIMNYTHKSVIQPHVSKQSKNNIVEKVQIVDINVQQKVKDLINHIENKQKIIQNNNKTRPQIKPAETVVEKKPPLPTLPTIKQFKNAKNSTPAYIPPRNQNEVTPKITQSTLKTSGTKVFKPQISIRKNQSKEKLKQIDKKLSAEKIQKSQTKKLQRIQPKQNKIIQKQAPKYQQPKIQVKQEKKENRSIKGNEKNKEENSQKNIQKIVHFLKPFDQILEALIGKNQANHKNQLKKLMIQYQNEEKGHKMHQQTNRNSLIRKINNYALSKHNVNKFTTHQNTRKRWIYDHQLFIYDQLLQNLNKQISNLQELKDCRIDPKQQYRLKKSLQTYQNRIDQIIQESKQVPNKIDLSFQFNLLNISSNNNMSKQISFQTLNQIKIHEDLLHLLEELTEKGSLQRKQMRCLQVLSQISIFKSKRCPIVILNKDYQKWKKFYQD